jgi:hypothetical protein
VPRRNTNVRRANRKRVKHTWGGRNRPRRSYGRFIPDPATGVPVIPSDKRKRTAWKRMAA